MSSNALEAQMQGYLADIKSVENELNAQLETLSTSIDQSFGQISKMVTALTDLAVQSTDGLVSNQNRSRIALVGQGVSFAVEAYGRTLQAYKHNKALDRLLAQKKAIASTKHESLLRVSKIAARVDANLKKILTDEGAKVYNLAELATSEQCDMLVDRMDKYLDMYRTSQYQILVINYLDCEYRAWLSGQQRGDWPRPDYMMANRNVIQLLEKADGMNAAQTLLDVFEGNPTQISGSGIYYLMDSQISATILADIREIHALPQPANEGLQHICNGNAGLEHYQSNVNNLQALMADGPEVYSKTKWGVVIGCGFLACLSLKDVPVFSVFLVLLAIVFILYFNHKEKKAQKEYVESLQYWQNKIAIDAFDDAGYVEQVEQDLEKRSLMAAFFGA